MHKIFGMQLVTHQTGPEGKKVQRLLVEQGLDIARELYLGLTLDRATGRVVVMASTEGGMEIEEVAEHHPEKILRAAIEPSVGLAGVAGARSWPISSSWGCRRRTKREELAFMRRR